MKIAIGPSSFDSANTGLKDFLRQSGFEVVDNPYKRKLTEDETIEHLRGAVGLLAGLEPISARVLQASPALKVIARVGVGLDSVDQEACRQFGITLSNTPDAPTGAVAELTVAALLHIARGLGAANEALHNGQWNKAIGFSLSGLKVLLIGAGRIGLRVKKLLEAFDCLVKTYDPYAGSDFATLDEALRWPRVVSLHASGAAQIIGAPEIEAMPDGVVILNSARGGLIDEDALYSGLRGGKIAACWLDVYSSEPYSGRLIECERALLTPHLGTYTHQCRVAMERQAVDNLLRDLGAHV